jgi:GNAT superfamily N-acetyltransferase
MTSVIVHDDPTPGYDHLMTAVITGTPVLVPATADAVRELVSTCSPAALRRRFFLPGDLDAGEVFARYRGYLLAGTARVAEVDDVPVGLINLVVVADRAVELSLLVADAWRRRGVATALLGELAAPRWAGWTVRAAVQPDNRPVRALLSRLPWPARVVGVDPSQIDVEIALPAR